MTDFEKVKSILENQQRKGVKSKDWQDTQKFIVEKNKFLSEKEYITLSIVTVKVGFAFTLKGRFMGIYNWQS